MSDLSQLKASMEKTELPKKKRGLGFALHPSLGFQLLFASQILEMPSFPHHVSEFLEMNFASHPYLPSVLLILFLQREIHSDLVIICIGALSTIDPML